MKRLLVSLPLHHFNFFLSLRARVALLLAHTPGAPPEVFHTDETAHTCSALHNVVCIGRVERLRLLS